MKRNSVAIIGGGYGDEGKGLMTDFMATRLYNPIIILPNGGCQRGHGVTTPTGKHHVFSHFSSGTFWGAPTFLSRFFVVNPKLFRLEHEQFVKKFGITPEIYVDAECMTTTPIEMMINQILEMNRGAAKHGSCGVGFGETLERQKRMEFYLTISYLQGAFFGQIEVDIDRIKEEYLPSRLNTLRIPEEFMDALSSKQLVDDFLEDLEYFHDHTTIVDDQSILYDRDTIFEAGQGLEIDQDYGVFPYVTRSNCGMRNITKLIEELVLDIDILTVTYVTRAYKTRHGAGPLRHEIYDQFPYADKTNKVNEWQGPLRWGHFRFDEYRSITDKDFALYANDGNDCYDVRRADAMTCLDQVNIVRHGKSTNLMKSFDYFSFGPTREHVQQNGR